MSAGAIAVLIIIAFIGIVWAVPAPEPKKEQDRKPEPQPATINVYRVSHVHKHVVIRVQMLVVAPPTDVTQPRLPQEAEPLPATRALERYKTPLELPAPRAKIEA